jgi:hypothetical protein
VPISAFARDQDESFYDHDFLEMTYRKAARNFTNLCSGLSFSAYWLEGAHSAYAVAGIARANTVLLAFGEAIERPRSVSGTGYDLHYLGRFPRSTAAPTPPGEDDGPPAVCYLEITGATALVDGRPAELISIDSAGAIIGQGGSGDGTLYIDLPTTEKPIALRQVRIYPNPFGQWIIEDLAGGDVTVYRGQALNHARVMPWHDQGLEVGGVQMCWLAENR